MADNLGSYAVNLPKIFQSPGEALQSATGTAERLLQMKQAEDARNQAAAERKAKELESDRLRGMAIIESGVKLDKLPPDEQAYLVGQEAVSKLKSNLMTQLNNKTIDPIALQTQVDNGMKGITNASNTFILEHNQADEIANQLARDNPSIDIAALKNDLRNDVRNRRIAQGQFVDPTQVQPSSLISQVTNPENLSKYITEYNALDKVMSSKQSSAPIRAKLGTPQEHTIYGGQVGFWAKPTFETDPMGFIKKGGKTPSMTDTGTEIRNEPLPANSLKGVDKPLDMVPEGVYQKFTTDGGNQSKSEIIALAQKQFPTYKNFTPQEKEFANRNALYNYLKNKDRDGFAGIGEVGYNPPPSYAGQKPTEGERKAAKIGQYLDSFTNAIKSNDVNNIKALAGKLYGLGGGKSKYSDIEIYKRPDGTVTGVQLKYLDSKGKRAGGDIIKADDPYLRDKLQGSYQQISGSESAAEIENLPELGGKTKPKPSANNKITVILDGEEGVIDASKWEAFKKKYPNAKRK
jgi:hypothetical protein